MDKKPIRKHYDIRFMVKSPSNDERYEHELEDRMADAEQYEQEDNEDEA